jgi:hypothetical protein
MLKIFAKHLEKKLQQKLHSILHNIFEGNNKILMFIKNEKNIHKEE